MGGAKKNPPLFFRLKGGVGGVTDFGKNPGESALKQLNKSTALIICVLLV